MDDLISRWAVKELAHKQVREKYCGMAFKKHRDFYIKLADSIIDLLPSAQPEIIYCKDCKYKDDGIDEDGIPFLKCLHGRSYGGTRINDFCSWAEKREVTT